jgi:predicted secreted protein
MAKHRLWVAILFCLIYLVSISECASEALSKASIVVAGNFSIDGKVVNLAQYDVQSGR